MTEGPALPEDSSAYRQRAIQRLQQKDWAGAQADFGRAKELQPGDPENWLGFGMSLAVQHQIYPALRVLEEMVERWPTFVRGHVQLGLLHIKLGTIPKAKELLERALTLNPTPEERRFIDSTLKEQAKLDQKRYYRPDFEALRKQTD